MPAPLTALPDDAVLLHVGPHKTGTTAIQSTLAPAREELAARGVTYPGRYTAHHLEAYSLRQYTQAWAGSSARPPAPRVFYNFARRVAARPGRVVVSSEFFAGCTESERARLVEELGRDRVHVLIGARNPAAFALSTWQQLLREGKADGLDAWLERDFRRPEPTRDNAGFWSKADPANLAEKWQALVGPERVTVVVMGDRDQTLLPTTFEQLLDLPGGFLTSRRPTNSNRGLTATEAEFLRGVTAAIGDQLSWSDHSQLVRSGMVRQLQQVRECPPGESAPALPGWALAQAAAEAERSIGELERLGVRIAGDLQDLGSLPPQGAGESVETVPVDLAVEAAVGTIRSAVERFRALEDEAVKERERADELRSRLVKVRRRNAQLRERLRSHEATSQGGLLVRVKGRLSRRDHP